MGTVTYQSLNNIAVAGRLGNNLFEVAATIGIAMINGMDYCFPEWKYRHYFKVELPPQKDLQYELLTEDGFYYQEFKLDPNKNYNLRGHFQSYKYFEGFENLIRFYFEPKTYYPQTGYVGVHVRRGDYLALQDRHPVLSKLYYLHAMSLFPRTTQFMFFSDDIVWCMQNFKGDNILYHLTGQDYVDLDDLLKLSRCEHIIMANSSFSWWAAWLNPNPNKIIICPRIYVGPTYGWTTKDLYPKDWRKL